MIQPISQVMENNIPIYNDVEDYKIIYTQKEIYTYPDGTYTITQEYTPKLDILA